MFADFTFCPNGHCGAMAQGIFAGFHTGRALASLLAVMLFASVATLRAQTMPFSPYAPTSAAECDAFARQVAEYYAFISKQHDECLAANKADRNEPPGSRVCSRSMCQNWHDQLNGDFGLTKKTQEQDVSICRKSVTEYLNQQAHEKQEDADRQALRRREQQEEASRRAARDQDRIQVQQQKVNAKAQPTKSSLRPKTPAEATSDRIPSAGQQAAESPQPSSSSPAVQSRPTPPQDLVKKRSEEALSEVQDPFEKAKHQVAALGLEPSPLVDPFSPHPKVNADVVNGKDEITDKAGEAGLKAMEKSTKYAEQTIDNDIELAQKQLRGKARADYIREATDTKAVVSGVARVATGLQYAGVIKDVYEASQEGSQERLRYQEAKLAAQVGHDTVYEWSKDAAKEGVSKVMVRLFPKTGPFLVRGISAAATGASVFFYSEPTEAEPRDIVEHGGGEYSLKDKRNALFYLWNHSDPTSASDVEMLIRDTDMVYKQAQQATSGDYGAVK